MGRIGCGVGWDEWNAMGDGMGWDGIKVKMMR